MKDLPELPVTAVLPDFERQLAQAGRAVLVAPPGAGKTTLAPLFLLDGEWLGSRQVILLEPRRLAARAAARRMASLLGEEVGKTVGYAMRLDRKLSANTRILVVTEGVFARMALDNPELPEIGVVLFDEFHERSLDADFGLALALDIAGSMRPDLRIAVMSATLDGARVAAVMNNAPVIESQGRSFPVTLRYRERRPDVQIADAMTSAIRECVAGEQGSILAFLPGQAEILQVFERLYGRLPPDVDVMPLHGGLDGRSQDAAIRPATRGRRKVVLATAIAESSITIDGVRIVIDSGLSRRPRFEPNTGITRLETVRVSQASAAQRAGRAGRTEPGVAVRLWGERQTNALPEFDEPEIMQADLSGLMLDCAEFGVADPSALAFLDAPPQPALVEARQLLLSLKAIDAKGLITSGGKAMRKTGLPVRLAHMVASAKIPAAATKAARLAMLISERGIGGHSLDLDDRLHRLENSRDERAKSALAMAARIAGAVSFDPQSFEYPELEPSTGALLAAAYPERIAKARGAYGHFVLANGRGCYLAAEETLAGEPFLVVADMQGKARNQRITTAASITEEEIRTLDFIPVEKNADSWFDRQSGSVRARLIETLGAIELSSHPLPVPSGDMANQAILQAVRELGLGILPWTNETTGLRERLAWLHRRLDKAWPDVEDNALIGQLDEWLGPFLTGKASLAEYSGHMLRDALNGLVPPELRRQIDVMAPPRFTTPAGRDVVIRYEPDGPVLAVKVQELFGLNAHPAIAGGREALVLELLSPAGRPLQKTRDLPGFWAGSWASVRAEMRGRYPKHDWPADPANATATSRAKPRLKAGR
jgi:ATP-dependent helicase HrpB